MLNKNLKKEEPFIKDKNSLPITNKIELAPLIEEKNKEKESEIREEEKQKMKK